MFCGVCCVVFSGVVFVVAMLVVAAVLTSADVGESAKSFSKVSGI